MIGKPHLSIVIANYNYGHFLEEAIRSILSQGMGDEVEIIVCDAASTDNSVGVIKKFAKGLPPNTYLSQPQPSTSTSITWWCSEKDGGQSAAFNKGFAHAKGDWFTWLNADDILLPGTVKAFVRFVEKNPDAEWITGNMLSFDSDARKIIRVNWGPHYQPPLLMRNRSFNAVFGPTTFWRRSIYEKIGPIDEKLHYAMDTEYWARMTMAGVKQYRLHHICWGFRSHSESKTVGLQTEEISAKREAETRYWKEKSGYQTKYIWYLFWVLWRFVDFSWLMRGILKMKYEGKVLDKMFQC